MKIVPIRSPDTTEQTLRQFPTGGVHAPTANPDTNTTPNKTSEIPLWTTTGKKTGVSKRMAGLTSMNVPMSTTIAKGNA